MTILDIYTMSDANSFVDLEAFERSVYSGNIVDAEERFYRLLDVLGKDGRGTPSDLILAPNSRNQAQDHLVTRLCAAIGQMVVHPDFFPRIRDVDTLMMWQSVLSKLALLTPFGNMDHILDLLVVPDANGVVSGTAMLKVYLLLSTESAAFERLSHYLRQDETLYPATCLMLVWASTGSRQSSMNREWAYEKLREFFAGRDDASIPWSLIHGYFMFCSYGFSETKHDLKTAINRIIAKKLPLRHASVQDLGARLDARKGGASGAACGEKRTMLVILEFFNPAHSVYRVLGKSLLACREHFQLVAIAWPRHVENVPEGFFDVMITLSEKGDDYCLDEVVDVVNKYDPAVVFYPSLGMTPWTLYFSNVRLAPVQFCAIGHGASSQATEIDYFLIEADIAGDPATYSERVVGLPPGSMPFYPPNGVEYRPRVIDAEHQQVNVGVCATFMKINWRFLSVCQRLDQRYRTLERRQKVAFTFFLGASASGVHGEVYRRLILSYLPDAVIHFHQPFQSYVDHLAQMDVSLAPFPFGGMNGVMDCARLGVVAVCMEGPQVHEAFDAGMWRRMGMPEWLIAHDEAEYEAAAIRLIEQSEERHNLRTALLEEGRWRRFFEGDASIFADYVRRLAVEPEFGASFAQGFRAH